MGVTELAELSGFSKSYISQVKNGKCRPSHKLLDAIGCKVEPKGWPQKDYLDLFLQSRRAMGVSPRTLGFYRERLGKFTAQVDYREASRHDIERFLNSIASNHNGLGTRHATFRALKTFYRWLNAQHGLGNPMDGMSAPILGKPILPSLSKEQVEQLLRRAANDRDRAVISLFTESGLRLSELAKVRASDINWQNRTIRVMGKGRKESYAAFGDMSEQCLKAWLAVCQPNGSSMWGLNYWGIAQMLKRLHRETGIPCNPHTFRRTFACLLRKSGVDTMTIKDLGRWESLEMVQRYTRSVTFEDSLKFYKAPLGGPSKDN